MTVISNIHFFDLLNNKRKNVTIEGYHVLHRARRREVASNNRYITKKVNKLVITIEGGISRLVINTYLKVQIPMLCRKFFKNIAYNRDYVHNFCNDPVNKIHRYCCEWYFYNLFKIKTEMVTSDNVPTNYNQLNIFDILYFYCKTMKTVNDVLFFLHELDLAGYLEGDDSKTI